MHTRVSDELDEALQDAARRLRVPVSNLVRNVLEDVFDVVEAVTENVGELVEDVVEEATDFGRRFENRWRRRTEAARERVVDVPPERPARPPEPPEPPRAERRAAARVPRRLRLAAGRAERREDVLGLRPRDAPRRRRPIWAWAFPPGAGPVICEPCLDRDSRRRLAVRAAARAGRPSPATRRRAASARHLRFRAPCCPSPRSRRRSGAGVALKTEPWKPSSRARRRRRGQRRLLELAGLLVDGDRHAVRREAHDHVAGSRS